MKRIISPYLIGLLKENIVYVVLNVIVCILILFFLSSNSQKMVGNNEKINVLTKETTDLQRRVTLFNKAFLNKEDLESSVNMLNSLIPSSEDYFSVIYALDKISQKTNFIITSYTINLKSSTQNKLKLTIAGSGDRNSFLKFLNEYNFGGGRLITSDKIELTPQISGQIKIDITFYNKDAKLGKKQQIPALSESLLKDLTALKEKVHFGLKEASSEGQLDFNYPRKINPF